MRRSLSVCVLLLAACSSSTSQDLGPKANVPSPEFSIQQIYGPYQANYAEGAMEVKYRFEIANKAEVPLTLRRITVSTVNPQGGAYTLTPPYDYYFNRTIAAHATEKVEFWARAYGHGRSMRENEPVTIKGVVYFQAPDGYVNQVFVRELDQMP